jgi:hypothetical protein
VKVGALSIFLFYVSHFVLLLASAPTAGEYYKRIAELNRYYINSKHVNNESSFLHLSHSGGDASISLKIRNEK